MPSRRTRNVLRPRIESMEDRAVPSQFVALTGSYGTAQAPSLPSNPSYPAPKNGIPGVPGGPGSTSHNPYVV